MKLTIELVPRTAWFKNLRSEMTINEWDELRTTAYKNAGYRCEICGGKGDKWPVECHELWKYDDDTHVQTLTGVIALCPACHEVKHIGLCQLRGRIEHAIKKLMVVNNINNHGANRLINAAFSQYEKRSQHDWTLDLTYLEQREVL